MSHAPGIRSLYADIFPSIAAHHSPYERIRGVGRAADLIGALLLEAESWVRPGLTGSRLRHRVHRWLEERGGRPLVHVNPASVAWHGIGEEVPMTAGMPVTIDAACVLDGWWADGAWTYVVGAAEYEVFNLVRGAWDAAQAVLAALRTSEGDLAPGEAASRIADLHGLILVQETVGHGVGRLLHQEPLLSSRSHDRHGLKNGDTLTVEPVLTTGCGKVILMRDGAGITADGEPAAYFECTVVMEEGDVRILGPEGWFDEPPGVDFVKDVG